MPAARDSGRHRPRRRLRGTVGGSARRGWSRSDRGDVPDRRCGARRRSARKFGADSRRRDRPKPRATARGARLGRAVHRLPGAGRRRRLPVPRRGRAGSTRHRDADRAVARACPRRAHGEGLPRRGPRRRGARRSSRRAVPRGSVRPDRRSGSAQRNRVPPAAVGRRDRRQLDGGAGATRAHGTGIRSRASPPTRSDWRSPA